jgi:hypothetical protein
MYLSNTIIVIVMIIIMKIIIVTIIIGDIFACFYVNNINIVIIINAIMIMIMIIIVITVKTRYKALPSSLPFIGMIGVDLSSKCYV